MLQSDDALSTGSDRCDDSSPGRERFCMETKETGTSRSTSLSGHHAAVESRFFDIHKERTPCVSSGIDYLSCAVQCNFGVSL